MKLRGCSDGEIRGKLGYTKGALQADYAQLSEEWRTSHRVDAQELREHQLLEVAAVKEAIWEAWQVSRGPERQYYGEPKLMQIYLDCIKLENELMGLSDSDAELLTAVPVTAIVVHRASESNGQT